LASNGLELVETRANGPILTGALAPPRKIELTELHEMSADQKSDVATEPRMAADGLPAVSDEIGAPERVANADAADPAPDIPALLEKAKAEAAELRDAWLRARADMDNIRKQAAADVARAHKYGIERFAGELLAVKDSLESSLAAENATPQALRAGVELTLKQLASAFDKVKLVEIDPKGEKFDPHKHQAMSMVDGPEPPNTVAQVFQKGYLLADRVLRPAMVAVTKPKDGAA
jgi:molecular chaperone GrpE